MRAEIQNLNNKGSIINASSVAGVAGFPKNSAYTAAKHGVIGLSRSAAKEVRLHFLHQLVSVKSSTHAHTLYRSATEKFA